METFWNYSWIDSINFYNISENAKNILIDRLKLIKYLTEKLYNWIIINEIILVLHGIKFYVCGQI